MGVAKRVPATLAPSSPCRACRRIPTTLLLTTQGAPEIPRFTAAYRVGDKIKGVKGREIGFGSKIGTEQGEGARYPSVAAISYTFEGRQRTTLHLEDRRAEPPARRTR